MNSNREQFLQFTETAGKDTFIGYNTFDLPSPTIIGSQEFTCRTQDVEVIQKMKVALENAQQIIVINTDTGLGDAVMSLRAISTLSTLYPGKVVSIPPEQITSLLPKDQQHWVSGFSVTSPGTVIVNLGMETRHAVNKSKLADRLQVTEQEIPDIRMSIAGDLNSLVDAGLHSSIIVTTDNGPAHVLNEYLTDPTMSENLEAMLQLFSTQYVGSDRFGIRGLGAKGILAEYKTLQ